MTNSYTDQQLITILHGVRAKGVIRLGPDASSIEDLVSQERGLNADEYHPRGSWIWFRWLWECEFIELPGKNPEAVARTFQRVADAL